MIAYKGTDSKMQCLEAVKRDGWAILSITNKQRSPEVCLEAVKQNGWVIQCLTNKQREIVRKAIKGEEK